MSRSEHYLALWLRSVKPAHKAMEKVTPEDLAKRVHPQAASVGFLHRHISETKLFFVSAFFQKPAVFDAQTLFVKDTGAFTDLEALKTFEAEAEAAWIAAVTELPDDLWDVSVASPLGTLTPAEALAYLIGHTNYHGGQLVFSNKYGSLPR